MNVLIRDDLFHERILEAARLNWPVQTWPGWVQYDPSYECKRASDLTTPLPPPLGVLLSRIAEMPLGEWMEESVIPDLSLWGAGLHEMPPGPGLTRHLDADTHPRLGLERVLSVVLWLHERWEPSWGGELVLESGLRISPAPGRLFAFDCRDEWHHVEPVTCPADMTRRSLAIFWYAAQIGSGNRPRALFDGHKR